MKVSFHLSFLLFSIFFSSLLNNDPFHQPSYQTIIQLLKELQYHNNYSYYCNYNMFASLVGLLHQPSIALRVPGDDTTFNPKEYPNVTVIAQGKVQGKIRLIHNTDDDSGLGLISTRIWVTKDNDKEEVAIRTRFEDRTLTFTLEVNRQDGL